MTVKIMDSETFVSINAMQTYVDAKSLVIMCYNGRQSEKLSSHLCRASRGLFPIGIKSTE